MGDFSVRCDISGIPLPCGIDILVIPMESDGKSHKYWYPLGLPIQTKMGSYGSGDGLEGFARSADPCARKQKYIHVIPDLWEEAGYIWEDYMKRESYGEWKPLAEEIAEERRRWQEEVVEVKADHLSAKDLEELRTFREAMFRLRADNTQWLRRLDHILLFGPEFGKTTPLREKLMEMVKGEPDADFILQLETLIRGFMASCITGRDLLGGDHDYPCEQYPTLKWDLRWAQAKVRAIKDIRKQLNRKESDD